MTGGGTWGSTATHAELQESENGCRRQREAEKKCCGGRNGTGKSGTVLSVSRPMIIKEKKPKVF